MFGRCIRGACLLLAALLVWLAIEGAMASVYLIPTSHLSHVAAMAGEQRCAIKNEEDGLYIFLCSVHGAATSPFRWGGGYEADRPARSALGWPGLYGVYDAWPQMYRTVCIPRLPAAGLLLIWPVIHWVRARQRKKLAKVPGFDVA